MINFLCFLISFTLLGADNTDIIAAHRNEPYHPTVYSFNVVLEPLNTTTVFSQITSPILKINKKMGDDFEENEVLMELDDKVYAANQAKAEAAVAKFQAELDTKKILYEDDALSRFELDDAKASLASAKADLTEANKFYESTSIKAPYKGKVARVAVQSFELAQTGKELIQLVNSKKLYAKFLVPSKLLKCLNIGSPLEITINETGETIKTEISRVSPIIDPSSSTIKIEAEIDNDEGKLWAGMTGKAQICNPKS